MSRSGSGSGISGLRSIPGLLRRLAILEQELGDTRRRVVELEASLDAIGHIQSDVRALAVEVTERLNRAED